MLITFIRRVIWTLLFRTVLPSSHPLTGVLVRIVVGHLHLLLPPDAHDLLAVGVPQLLKQDEQQTHRVQAALSTATHTHTCCRGHHRSLWVEAVRLIKQ